MSRGIGRAAPVVILAMLLITGSAAEEQETPAPSALECLALTLYWEARDQGRDGMAAVAAVVLNRVDHADFPGTVCAVVADGGEQPPCQFSWWCDGRSDKPEDEVLWQDALEVARAGLSGDLPDPTGGALYYHAEDADASWTEDLQPAGTIGDHVFYR